MRSKYIFTPGLPIEKCILPVLNIMVVLSMAKMVNEISLIILRGVHFKNNVFIVNKCLYICLLISNMWSKFLKVCKYFKVFVKNLLVFVLLFYALQSPKDKGHNLYFTAENWCHS